VLKRFGVARLKDWNWLRTYLIGQSTLACFFQEPTPEELSESAPFARSRHLYCTGF